MKKAYFYYAAIGCLPLKFEADLDGYTALSLDTHISPRFTFPWQVQKKVSRLVKREGPHWMENPLKHIPLPYPPFAISEWEGGRAHINNGR